MIEKDNDLKDLSVEDLCEKVARVWASIIVNDATVAIIDTEEYLKEQIGIKINMNASMVRAHLLAALHFAAALDDPDTGIYLKRLERVEEWLGTSEPHEFLSKLFPDIEALKNANE